MSKSPLCVDPPAFAGRAGVARGAINPPVGIYARSWGAAKHDVAEGQHRPLYVTALALQDTAGGKPLLLISMDLGWCQGGEGEALIRQPILDKLGLGPERVMINYVHSHATVAVTVHQDDKPGGHLIRPYLQQVAAQTLAAAQAAVANLQNATVTFQQGRCDLASNRDLLDPSPQSQRYLCGFNPAGSADDTLLVGRVTAHPSGQVLATLVNYACHPTTLAWQNRLISPDYIGAARELIEGQTNAAPCLFLQGASGELSPRWQYVGETEVADNHGRQLGYACLSALQAMLPPRQGLAYRGVMESGAPLALWRPGPFEPSTRLRAHCFDVDLPLRKMATIEQLQKELEQCQDRTLAERLRRKILILQMVGSGQSCPMPAWLWQVGDVLLVGQANEAYSVFQTSLRAAFPNHAVVVMNLVNGACGYLYPPELEQGPSLYQVWQSPFTGQGLPQLIQSCQQHLGRLIQ